MSKTVWDRIEEVRKRCNVLEHPFYVRWSAGDLDAGELAYYSGQYRHAVEAIAEVSDYLAAELPQATGLAEHAREERRHVADWDSFVDAVGGDSSDAAAPRTAECVEIWAERDGALSALARLYAIESGQPEISRTKLEGLRDHYGIDGDAGTRYFTVHRGLDVEHAAEGRELLEQLIETPEDEARVLVAVESALAANWRLLDGVA